MSQFESKFEEDLYQLRRDKLTQIAALVRAANPDLLEAEARFPNSFAFTQTVPELREIGDPKSTEDLAEAHIEAAIAGRIMAIRVQGKAGFAQIQQGGQRLQIYVRKDDVGEDIFALYKLLDLGDHIGVRGYLMRTRTGELTLHAAPVSGQPAITFLTKSMLALPDKYHGLEDVELRYRQRYVDLIMNSGTRENVAPANTALSSSHSENATPANTPLLSSRSEAEGPASLLSSRSEAEGPASPAPSTDLSSRPERSAVERPASPAAALTLGDPSSSMASSSTKVGPHDSSPATDNAPINVREVFVKRAAILRSIRRFFDSRNYLEVETPMLHTVAGGAAARPFKTHHNALEIPLSLRIAPELYLKRLVVGGMDRVYEINRNFRNEGVSTKHNPEFTMLEFYQAYANYHDLMDLTQELITTVAQEVNGTTITHFNGHEIDLSKWTKLSMREAIIKFWPRELGKAPDASAFDNYDSLLAWMTNAIQQAKPGWIEDPNLRGRAATIPQIYSNFVFVASQLKDNNIHYGSAIAEVFELLAETELIQPTIIYDFPLAVSPLSKVKPDEPDWVERFEFYIGGFEVGNAFSELNDPDDQRNRFLAQVEEKERGDEEAMAEIDEDYVRALGYGLPPTAGEGIGIDRLTMLLTGSRSIRDVILFPLMRPHKPQQEPETHGESAE